MIVAASVATSVESMRRGRRYVDGEISATRPGPAREQHDPIAEPHRLAHVVGHEDHGLARLAPHGLELVVEAVARHGVERAERLVHQQHLGVLRERAGERDPLAHAARELVRSRLGEVAEVHHLEQLSVRVRRSSRADPAQLQRELDVAPRRQPREQRRLLEHQPGAVRPDTSTVPDVGWSRPATMLSSVLLPQPDAPSRQTNSPGATSRLMRSSAATEARPLPNTFETSAMETADRG